MRFFSSVFAFVILISVATTLSAGVIVENSPATGLSFRIGGPNSQAEAVVWAQTAQTEVSITALIGSVDGSSRTVDVYLEQNAAGNVIASTTVTVGSFANPSDFTPTLLFSGLALPGATYRITLFNTDTTGNVNIRWALGGGTANTADGIFIESEYSENPGTDVLNPYLSAFVNSADPLGFTVSSVPEPSTILTSLSSLIVFGAACRIRRRVICESRVSR